MLRLAFVCLAACLACCAGQLKVDDLNVPPGFSVNVFANDTSGARSLAISRNATYAGTILYVSTDTSVRVHNTFLYGHAMHIAWVAVRMQLYCGPHNITIAHCTT